MFGVKAYGYNKDDLTKRISLQISDEAKYIEYLKTTAEKYPFLAIMGLRILTEIKLKTFLTNQDVTISDKAMLGNLIALLPNKVTEAQKKTLRDFAEFKNIASHGYEISKETARRALEAIPTFLESIR